MNKSDEFYFPEGYPKKCFVCGAGEFIDTVKDFIDFGVPGGGPATEIEYKCKACSTTVAYWAYGYFDPAFRLSIDNDFAKLVSNNEQAAT